VPDDIFLLDPDDEPAEVDATVAEADEFTPEGYDEYLTAEDLLENMGTVSKGKVTGRKRDAEGNPIGRRNANPILDTREYEVEFPDGATNVFTANLRTCIRKWMMRETRTRLCVKSLTTRVMEEPCRRTMVLR
jgi:hypothetical protein